MDEKGKVCGRLAPVAALRRPASRGYKHGFSSGTFVGAEFGLAPASCTTAGEQADLSITGVRGLGLLVDY